MENPPPPQYASYPRAGHGPDAAARVQSLYDGYKGLNMVFVVNLIGALALNGYLQVSGQDVTTSVVVLGGFLVLGVAIALLSLPHNRKIGFGAGWDSGRPVLASVLMGINSAFCCGIVGFIVMQTIANNHLKTYGVTGGLFGPKKKEVEAKIAELNAGTPSPPSMG